MQRNHRYALTGEGLCLFGGDHVERSLRRGVGHVTAHLVGDGQGPDLGRDVHDRTFCGDKCVGKPLDEKKWSRYIDPHHCLEVFGGNSKRASIRIIRTERSRVDTGAIDDQIDRTFTEGISERIDGGKVGGIAPVNLGTERPEGVSCIRCTASTDHVMPACGIRASERQSEAAVRTRDHYILGHANKLSRADPLSDVTGAAPVDTVARGSLARIELRSVVAEHRGRSRGDGLCMGLACARG